MFAEHGILPCRHWSLVVTLLSIHAASIDLDLGVLRALPAEERTEPSLIGSRPVSDNLAFPDGVREHRLLVVTT